jgi:SAM-dependent methyltransferase
MPTFSFPYVARRNPLSDNYDRIARFYDVDMARNMAFDDVGFYVGLCAQVKGPVLELGCGNGRILLELAQHGIDAIGVDGSAGMLEELRRKAVLRSLPVRALRMDVADLALRPGFAAILCPYSLITYITDDDEVARLLTRIRGLLAPGGMFVIDAFVPKPVVAQAEFREDYRRSFGAHTLRRSKRIQPLGAATNRIERRYQVLAEDGAVLEQVDVVEIIRPYSPEALRQAVAAAGFVPGQEWWDYGARPRPEDAQFFALSAYAGTRPD